MVRGDIVDQGSPALFRRIVREDISDQWDLNLKGRKVMVVYSGDGIDWESGLVWVGVECRYLVRRVMEDC